LKTSRKPWLKRCTERTDFPLPSFPVIVNISTVVEVIQSVKRGCERIQFVVPGHGASILLVIRIRSSLGDYSTGFCAPASTLYAKFSHKSSHNQEADESTTYILRFSSCGTTRRIAFHTAWNLSSSGPVNLAICLWSPSMGIASS
jgi:hypothetical protein